VRTWRNPVRVHEGFVVDVRRAEGSAVAEIVVRAARSFEAKEIVVGLFSLEFPELAELTGLGAERARAFTKGKSRYILSNGWQSWSFAGELGRRERVLPGLVIEGLNTYVLRPGPREGRDEVLSHFFTRMRIGESRIVAVSVGPGPNRPGAPLAFRIDRHSLAMAVEAHAGGCSWREGDVVARIACAGMEGVFAERDLFRSLFAGDGRFERLAFLGSDTGTVPGGYESWYNHYTAITERIISSDLAAIGSNGNLINCYYIRRGKPTVFQIDDGWETAIGDWEPQPAKFPGGMARLARDIESKGLIPGIWLAPFIVERGSRAASEHADWLLRDKSGRPVVAGWNDNWSGDFNAWDLSNPEVGSWLDATFRRVVDEWGFRYLKLDFLYAGFLEGGRRGGGAAWEHYERVVSRITSRRANAAGLPIAWLGCGAPLESSYRHFPLMRIGADTKEAWDDFRASLVRHQGRPSAKLNLLYTLGRSVLDGSVFVNDPDVVFCRTKGMRYAEKEKELIAAVARMFASQIMFSDDSEDFGGPAEIAFTDRVVAFYDRIEGMEFGAQRTGRDLFTVSERDGKAYGWINLGSRGVRVRDSGRWSRDPAFPFRARRLDDGWLLEGRSMTLLASSPA